ncbi:MAG: transcriptional repressor [Epsilonproteobacteria bacterium]|nr:MAG: transcriptional repressor [Campylobacterota bacterium]
MKEYRAVLKAVGLKATIQRLKLMEVIGHSGHITVDDMVVAVHESHPSISVATVYKNISQMLESGIVVEIPIVGQKSQYELKKMDHIHLICTDCGFVEDEQLDIAFDQKLNYAVTKDSFLITRSQINLYGLCYNCQTVVK